MMKKDISLVFVFFTMSIITLNSQVGIATTSPRGTLEVYEPSEITEAPILVISGHDFRNMSILQPDMNNDTDPFTIRTDNAFQFRVDAKDALVIDSDGDIGINTTDAQADFHIAGDNSTVRFDFLNTTNNIFNNGIDASVLMVDGNGEFFLKESVDDFPVNDSDDDAFFDVPIALADEDGDMVAAVAYSKTITLTKKTLIEVVFFTNVQVRNFFGNIPIDQKPRIYGGIVTHQDTNTDIAYSASSYTNALTGVLNLGDIKLGNFTIGGNGFISLDPGVHTINLNIFAEGGGPIIFPLSLAQGHNVTFGSGGINRFQIIYHN